ncbi:response regulator [Horticoccus luteus]|uniref:Response regulator n=1 Tax=Horticoccus luteus TaxID=2862869 RepID=A0A8F9XLL5_9BACT|nr:response regulator [Horticoccus luteus]QYM79346.1 response regulator [Horticoccus luteus]
MPKAILLVEDNIDDVLFMKRALSKSGVPNRLFVVENGQKALDYLAGREPYADRSVYPLPRLVLLDLKLPEVPGFDVLRWIRSEPELAGLAVVVLTSSDHPSDIRQAYALGANSFLSKPGNADELGELVRSLADYWLKRNVVISAAAGAEVRSLKTSANAS